MKVKFIGKEQAELIKGYKPSHITYLEEQISYLVFGLKFFNDGSKIFFVDSAPSNTFPVAYDSSYFQVVDPKLSCHWIYSYNHNEVIISFKEWVTIPNAIDLLIDGLAGEECIEGYYLPTFLEFRNRLLAEEIGHTSK